MADTLREAVETLLSKYYDGDPDSRRQVSVRMVMADLLAALAHPDAPEPETPPHVRQVASGSGPRCFKHPRCRLVAWHWMPCELEPDAPAPQGSQTT